MRKKIWAWIMTVMMVISMMPTSVFAGINDTTKQTDNGQKVAAEQTNADQIGNYFKVNVSKDKDNKNVGTLENSPTLKANKWADTQKTYEDNKVKVNKTIEATDEENVFDITLTVSTSEKIEKVESNADAAVVLVIDCSGSMKDGNRLATAKKAAQTFINGFVAKKADGTVDTSVKRKIAIVSYSGSVKNGQRDGAYTVLGWTDASVKATPTNTVLCSELDSLTAKGATNTEAGLMLGRNLLEQYANDKNSLKGIGNKNIILLTDGKPTLGVTAEGEDKYATATDKICPWDNTGSPDPWSWDYNSNYGNSTYCEGDGNNTSHSIHEDVETLAQNLNNKYGAYAIYVGNEDVKCNAGRGTSCDLKNSKSGAKWLDEDCGFDTYAATDDDKIEELIEIFKSILEVIEHKAQAWILTDPMGTNIEFDSFKTTSSKINEFVENNNQITWDLKGSPRGVEDSETGYTTYELKYRVKLDTLADGYSAGTYYATNGVTSVTYLITKTENSQTSYKFDTAYFNVPSVKGYDAGFSFKKVGSFGEALSGATFKLTHACGESYKDEQASNASWATATSDSNGIVSFANIPSGHKYTLTETKAPGTNGQYTKSNETYTVTVAYGELTITDKDGKTVDASALQVVNESDTIDIEGTKTWDDNNNQDGKRPSEITVELYANGQKVTEADGETAVTAVANAGNGWKWSFNNLPKYKGGEEITYTIKEVNVPAGYEASNNGVGNAANNYTITNSHTPETIDISGTKTWKDNNDQDGKRPSEITIKLFYKNGDKEEVVKDADNKPVTTTATAANGWKWSFTGLDKYKDGKEIKYVVKETAVEGYTSDTKENDDGTGFVITNTHTPETTSISGTKTWDDADNQDGKRPESITVKLMKGTGDDAVKVAEKTVKAGTDGNWTYSFTNLPKYENGNEITYTVVEATVPDGYEADVDGYDITNTHTPEKVNIEGTKTWDDNNNQDGKRPESITVKLLADGEAAVDKDGEAITTTVTADNNWSYSFNNLPKFKDGKAITYTVVEATVPDGYESTVDGYNITNTHTPETVDISGTKTWKDADNQDGKRPESIKVNLLADGEAAVDKDGKAITTTVKAGSDGNWTWSFDNLPKYKDGEVGQEIAYTVTEEAVKDYTSKVTGSIADGFTITNTHEVEKTSINVAKVWADDDNRDNIRPDEITVKLFANGSDTGKTVKLNKENKWEASFTDLDKNSGGKAIEYTVDESGLPEGYTSTVNGNATVGYTITNSHTPAFVSISGTKTWNDGDNQDGIRPEKITVRLLADGTEVNSQTVAGTDNTWSYTFSTDKDGENLPKYNKGKEIKYTVSEDSVDGYTPSVNGYNITNTHTPSVTSISGSKTWNDNGDQDGVRPESITVRLHADGKEIASRTVTAASGWSWSFTNLPVNKAGVEINYTITEDAVQDYTPAINGANITNTHTPDKTSVAVSKAWNDDNNRDGKRASIDVVLYANGTSTGKTITLTESNGWTGTFTGLDKNSNGEAVNYTVKEANAPAGYSSSITGDADKGYTITNTYSPEKTSVSGSKTWNDDNNRDGKRPEKITVRLFANDKQIDQKVVGENDGWAWSFDDLYKYENGKEISYTITEDEVAEYATEIKGYDITNTYDDFETTEITVNKTWKGDSERERPDAVTVNLLADGKVVETVDLTAKDGWTHTFTDLPKYASGKAGTLVVYSVEEEAVEGYTPEIAGFEITNVKNPPADEDTPNPPADPGKPGKSDNGDKAAKTGDDMNIFALAGTAFAALIGAFAAFFRRKKKA